MSDRHETLRTEAQFDAAAERTRKHGIWGWLEVEARRARTREAELEREVERLRGALEWMVSPESDWENGEVGVGHQFRARARAALSPPKETP